MASLPPIIRHILVCDGVAQSGSAAVITRDFKGVTNAIQAKPGETFPITYPELCVYVSLTGGSGTGRIGIVIVDADTDIPVLQTPTHDQAHPPDRHVVVGIAFRLRRCVFPRPGLYWVEFWHDGMSLSRVPLIVR